MRKITTFTLNGQPVRLKRRGTATEAVRSLLDKLPEGSLLTADDIAKRLECSLSAVRNAKADGYFLIVGRQVLWGSKRTIQQAEDAIGDNG